MRAAILLALLGAAAVHVNGQDTCLDTDYYNVEDASENTHAVPPPLLINTNLDNSQDGDVARFETGVSGDDLTLAFTISAAIYSNTNTDATGGSITPLTESSAQLTGGLVHGTNGVATGSAAAYAEPTVFFVSQEADYAGSGGASTPVDSQINAAGYQQCTFGAGGSYETVADPANRAASTQINRLNIRHKQLAPLTFSDPTTADTVCSNTGANSVDVYGKINLRRALDECNFQVDNTNTFSVPRVAALPGSTIPNSVPALVESYGGTSTVAAINALAGATAPTQDDWYKVSDAGTLTAGALVVAANDYVKFDQGAWVALAAPAGATDYGGAWNAATNTPDLATAGANTAAGRWYRVSVTGTTTLNSISTWNAGDLVVFGTADTATRVEASGSNVPSGSTYTNFLGKLKMVTTRYGGMLRTKEVIRRDEWPFQISILLPNFLQVSSAEISVIGAVVEQAAVTHQIWNSGAALGDSSAHSVYGDVDINVLMGTTFPHAVTTYPSGTDIDGAGPGTAIPAPQLVLAVPRDSEGVPTVGGTVADLTPACTPWDGTKGFVAGDAVNFGTVCGGGQTTTLYRAGILCDSQTVGNAGYGVCDIGDFFDTVNNVANGDFYTGSNQPADGTTAITNARGEFPGFNTGTSTNDFSTYPLPTTRCSQSDSGNQNNDACLQNIWMTLRPRRGWCDLNVALELTLGVVCRDDADGNNNNNDVAAGVTDATEGFIEPTSTLNLRSGGQDLTCTSQLLSDKQVFIAFSLASDDFCPRLIATGDTTEDMALFESELGAATWGARVGFADQAAANAFALNSNTAIDQSSECAGIPTGTDHTVVGTGNPPVFDSATNDVLCRQSPYLYPEGETQPGNANDATSWRKTQDQFVFGTYVYGETRVIADAGVNIADAELTTLWISNGAKPSTEAETASTWAKLLIASGVAGDTASAGTPQELLTSYKTGNPTVATSSRVEVSQNIVSSSLIRPASANGIGANSLAFFNTNPSTTLGHRATRLGPNYEGVARFRVLMDEYTIAIQDPDEEDPETITFYGDISITYEPAASQTPQGTRLTEVMSSVPSAFASRARSMASPAVTGGQASGRATVAPPSTAGSAGGASTVAGFSSTTVLAAAAVFGAVVAAAGASFFVVRKRRNAARSAKRSSSSMELNDTAQVQV